MEIRKHRYKYFIAILPDQEVASSVTAFRKQFLPGVNPKDEHKKFPHITLQHTFSRLAEIEEELQPHLIKLASSFQPFSIYLSGTGNFNRQVIYIGVEQNQTLSRLHSDLIKLLVDAFQFTAKEVTEKYTPHITLEKKLDRQTFESKWQKVSATSFNAEFVAKSFSLMRHTGRVWEEIDSFTFGSANR